MKIIFLDIDGVLNNQDTLERTDFDLIGIDKKLVQIFNYIIEKTEAKVVLSSTWRRDPDWQKQMEVAKLKCEFLGATPMLWGQQRGEEIQDWMENCQYRKHIEEYAIIDDDCDFLPGQRLFRTRNRWGLTKEIADEVINYLNS